MFEATGTRYLRTSAAAIAFALISGTAPAQPAWKPEKPVELIALNAPGGGGDRILRIMSSIMQERRHLDVPANVVNKPGGGGAVAYAYLNQHPGDAHYLVLASKSILTNHIAGRGPSYTEFTPVAFLFGEYISVTVKPESPLKTGRDIVERLKKDPAVLSFGIATSMGNPNHQGVASALKAAGVDIRKMRTVIFPSGGAATTAMLGGHVDVVPITAAFAASMARQGQVRVITVTAPSRLADVLADVPRGASRATMRSCRTGGGWSDPGGWPRCRSPTGSTRSHASSSPTSGRRSSRKTSGGANTCAAPRCASTSIRTTSR